MVREYSSTKFATRGSPNCGKVFIQGKVLFIAHTTKGDSARICLFIGPSIHITQKLYILFFNIGWGLTMFLSSAKTV